MTPQPHLDVLVVDDSRMMRALVTRGLCLAGVPSGAIIEAANGVQALEQVRSRAPGLVVTDIHMPEMGGLELLERLSAEGLLEHMPVVVVTSLSSSRRILEFIRLGAAAVIRKPIDPEGLARELAPFVERLRRRTDDAKTGHFPLPPSDPGADDVVDLDAVLEIAALGVLRANHFPEAQRVATARSAQRLQIGATILLHAPVTGIVSCWADLDAASALAESMSGAAPPDDDGARVDAVAELCNQLVGSFFGHVAQAEGDPLRDSDFGLPVRFVLAPGVALSPYHQTFQIAPGMCVICHIEIATTDVVVSEVRP